MEDGQSKKTFCTADFHKLLLQLSARGKLAGTLWVAVLCVCLLRMSEQLVSLKLSLKKWERNFQKSHGRKASKVRNIF